MGISFGVHHVLWAFSVIWDVIESREHNYAPHSQRTKSLSTGTAVRKGFGKGVSKVSEDELDRTSGIFQILQALRGAITTIFGSLQNLLKKTSCILLKRMCWKAGRTPKCNVEEHTPTLIFQVVLPLIIDILGVRRWPALTTQAIEWEDEGGTVTKTVDESPNFTGVQEISHHRSVRSAFSVQVWIQLFVNLEEAVQILMSSASTSKKARNVLHVPIVLSPSAFMTKLFMRYPIIKF